MTGPDQPTDRESQQSVAARSPQTPAPGTRAQARDELLARLAAQVRIAQTATERRLDVLEATTAESADLLAQALPRIDTALDQLAALAERLDDAPLAPISWPTLTVAEAATVWAQLADWIESVLVGWYGITRAQLPDCWALHRPVLHELTWLHTTYREAHTPGARAALSADWHTRWRPAALAAITAATDPTLGAVASGCRPGHHHDPAGYLPAGAYTSPPDEPVEGQHVGGRQKLLARREFWQANYLTAVRFDRDWRERRTPPPPA
jgi:hypothetical protein